MQPDHFFACRVLSTKPDSLDYVVFERAELSHRNDVEVTSRGFTTMAEAEAVIKQLGGTISAGPPMFLDFYEEDNQTVWCWKDERTRGASQTFGSEREAMDAWHADKLVFDALLD